MEVEDGGGGWRWRMKEEDGRGETDVGGRWNTWQR